MKRFRKLFSEHALERALKPAARMLFVLLAVTVLFGLLPAMVQAVEYRLEDFVILVDDQLVIKGYADVNSYAGGIGTGGIPRRTDLGSRNRAEIGGKGRCRIPLEAPTPTDVAIIAPNVTLGNFASVSHVIYDAATGSYADVGTSGRIGPTLLEDDMGNNSLNDTGTKDLPDFPPFPSPIVPGVTDVIVPSGGSQTIPPGDYRDLIAGHKVKIQLQSGIYTFRRIIFKTAGEYNLLFEDDTEIRVLDFVTLAEYGNVNPTMAQDVIFYVNGADGTYGGENKNPDGVYGEPAAFYYAGDGHFSVCFVYVPNGTIGLRGKSQPPHITQWFGRSFLEVSTLRISLSQSSEVCYEQAGIDCACITDFKLRSDGTLLLKGVNLSTATVEKLAIFTEAASLPLGGIVGGDAGVDQLQATLNFLAVDRFETQNNVESALIGAGYSSGDKFILGIIYPVNTATGNVGGYCILTDKLLKLP